MILSRSARSAPGASSQLDGGPGASRLEPPNAWAGALRDGLSERRVEIYVSAVTVLGVAAISYLAAGDLARGAAWFPPSAAVAILGSLTLATELVPIRIDRGDDVEEVTTSTSFAFALLLLAGTAPAVYVLAVASAVADVSRRKQVRKILFNLGQYALITTIAGWLFRGLGGVPGRSALQPGPVFVSAVAFFSLNTLLTGIVVAFSERTPVVEHVRAELVFNVTVAATLLAMSPVLVLVAKDSLPLLFVFLLPVGAVQFAAKGSRDRAALIEQLRDSLARMTELNRAKDEFVAVVSHELRTPLTSVRGYIRTLLQLGEDLSEVDVRTCLEAADRQGERLQQQIERLLFVASLDTRRGRLGPAHTISVPEVVAGIVADMDPLLRDHRVVVHADEDVAPITTHEGSLTHIVTNLLENAAKYSAAGTEIDVDVRSNGDGVLLSVRDRGPGIPEEYWDRIFERFFQTDSSSTRTVGGTGLGLYIAASCAADVGGRVWLQRSDGTGSEFCAQLPSMPDDADARSAASDITASASA